MFYVPLDGWIRMRTLGLYRVDQKVNAIFFSLNGVNNTIYAREKRWSYLYFETLMNNGM